MEKTDPRFLILMLTVMNYLEAKAAANNVNPLMKSFGNAPSAPAEGLRKAETALREALDDLDEYFAELQDFISNTLTIEQPETQHILEPLSLDTKD